MLKILRRKQRSRATTEEPHTANGGVLIGRSSFMRTLLLEQKRTERSRRRFVLMLLESGGSMTGNQATFEKVLNALSSSTRETDVKGWYRDGAVVGVIFTEIAPDEGRMVAEALLVKIRAALSRALTKDQANQIHLSCHVFPEDWHDRDQDSDDGGARSTLAPNLLRDSDPRTLALLVKRSMDITGSLFAFLLLAPVFLAIAIAIKLTSKGPIFFRQPRVGHYGRKFTFLKFRSMYFENDHAIHEEFVKQLITGNGPEASPDRPFHVYKITDDPRVTPVGKFLRRTSLDELPQFFNVLRGEMSLVGPRPPIPYEVNLYDIWHKRRLLAVKPGITGLWQVMGRSRTKFDEMVRLDLTYGRSWSLWMDIKILLLTPRAVFSGDGAY
jgi:lipopolysaccharide/colanic/teichoic acid biosynthesis glycosyltransferase